MTSLGWALKALVLLGLIAAMAAIAVGASAALDAPSRSSTTETVIDAPREEVWGILVDFESYPEWNPYMRTVQGRPSAGSTLDIRLQRDGGEARDIKVKVFVFKPMRKLRWQDRLLVPGLRDLEYEVIVAPLGPSRAQVTQRARLEGLLMVFADFGSLETGLENMASALKRRAEAGA